jgi:hypothetical protein
MDQVGLVDYQKGSLQEFLLAVKLRIEVGRYLLIGCHYGCGVRYLIMTLPPEEVEDLGERLLSHKVEMPQKLKDPLQVLTTPLPQSYVLLFSEEIPNIFLLLMERNSQHQSRQHSILYGESTIDDLPIICILRIGNIRHENIVN